MLFLPKLTSLRIHVQHLNSQSWSNFFVEKDLAAKAPKMGITQLLVRSTATGHQPDDSITFSDFLEPEKQALVTRVRCVTFFFLAECPSSPPPAPRSLSQPALHHRRHGSR